MKIGKRIERALAVCRFARIVCRRKGRDGRLRPAAGPRRQPDHLSPQYVMIAARRAGVRPRHPRPQQPALPSPSRSSVSRSPRHLPDHVADGRLNVHEKLIARARVDLQTADAHTLDARPHPGHRAAPVGGLRRNLRTLFHASRRSTARRRSRKRPVLMMYDVRQVTDYRYARPVVFAQHVLRIVPVNRPGQSVDSCRLTISPEPSARRDDTDFFGNHRIFLDLDRPHRELIIEMAARITVNGRSRPLPGMDPPWETGAGDGLCQRRHVAAFPVHALFPSTYVPRIRRSAPMPAPPSRQGAPSSKRPMTSRAASRRIFTYDGRDRHPRHPLPRPSPCARASARTSRTS